MPKYKINNRLAGHEKKTKNYGGGEKSDFKKNIQTFSPGLSKRLPPDSCIHQLIFPM